VTAPAHRELVLPRGQAGDVLVHDGTRWVAGEGPSTGNILHATAVYPGPLNTLTNGAYEAYLSYSLPAGALQPGEGLRIRGAVSCTGSNVTKNVLLTFGGVTIAEQTGTTTASWFEFNALLQLYTSASNGHTWLCTAQRMTFITTTNSAVAGHHVTGSNTSFGSPIAIELSGGINAAAGSMAGRLLVVEQVRLA
jgi:hypothetical protein